MIRSLIKNTRVQSFVALKLDIVLAQPAFESAKKPPNGPPNKQSVNCAVLTSDEITVLAKLLMAEPSA